MLKCEHTGRFRWLLVPGAPTPMETHCSDLGPGVWLTDAQWLPTLALRPWFQAAPNQWQSTWSTKAGPFRQDMRIHILTTLPWRLPVGLAKSLFELSCSPSFFLPRSSSLPSLLPQASHMSHSLKAPPMFSCSLSEEIAQTSNSFRHLPLGRRKLIQTSLLDKSSLSPVWEAFLTLHEDSVMTVAEIIWPEVGVDKSLHPPPLTPHLALNLTISNVLRTVCTRSQKPVEPFSGISWGAWYTQSLSKLKYTYS